VAAALFVVLSLTLTSSPALAAGDPVDEVHYTFTSGTSIALDWRGAANDVRWGPTAAYGSSATGTAPQWTPWSSAGPFWQVELTGLTPGAVYHYSIGGGPDWTFHTPPSGEFRFDAIGDIGSTTAFSKLGNTLDQIANDDPSFVLMIGDLTYANATNATQAVVDQHFNDVMRWSTSAAYMPAWGNHEYDVAGADDLRNYKGRLLMPHAAASPGSPDISCCGDDWGWFDAGGVRFIAYPEPWTGALADWQSKAATLMQQAQNDPSITYVVTYGHRPAYSTGYHPGEPKLAGILDGFGDSYSKYVLNLVGHSHDYERFQPIHGVTHVTIGSPSSAQGPWSSTDPRTAYRALHLAHLRVDVSSTGLRIQAICGLPASSDDITCDNGSVIDEYTIGVPPVVPTATDFYVDKTMSTCSDTGQGTAATPYCTIAKGLTRMAPGTTLFVGDGTYAETVKFSGSGTATKPITVTAWPGRDPVVGQGMSNGVYISGRSYIRISNLHVDHSTADGIYLSKSDHLTITGNTVTHAGLPQSGQLGAGFYVKTVTDSLVSANTADHNTDTGIYLTLSTTRTTISYNEVSFNAAVYTRRTPGIWVTSSGNTIIGNVTHDNEDSGIYFSSNSADNLATLNVTYDNGDHGIDNLNVTNNRLIGNTVYRNCTSGINVEGTSSGVVVKNNVAVDNAVYPAYGGVACSRRAGNIGVYDSATSSTVVDHNLVWLTRPGAMYVYGASYTSLDALKAAHPTLEVHGVQGDPRFANAAAWDLQLLHGSAAIDRADSGASGEQPTDVNGHDRVRDPTADNSLAEGPRRYDDLGAYEFQPDQGQASAPNATLTASPTSGATPLPVTADASGSSDPQGESLTFTFDFGDGSPVVGPQSSPVATHTYDQTGVRTLTVSVANTSGLSSTATQTITITATGSAAPPTARLTVTPTTGTAPLAVTADAAASTDPQGQTLTYSFDFGDGSPVVGPQASAQAEHTYATAGSYTVTATATNQSALSAGATQAVTVSAAPAAPTARLAVTPTSGSAPLAVSADAAASTDPQGQALTYSFDFGDGSPVVGPQTSPQANHTYVSAGSYTVTVTVRNTSGLTSPATGNVTVSVAVTTQPKYVEQIATNYSTTANKTSGYVTVWRGGGVPVGELAVVTLQLTGSPGTGPVTATDARGNSYAVASDVADGQGGRLVVLYGRVATALDVNDKITAGFPAASGYRMIADRLHDAAHVDVASSATGTTPAFSSGAAQTTSAPELVFGVVALTSGSAAPVWDAGWTALAPYAVGSNYVGRAWRAPTSPTSASASGSASGRWLASVVAFAP
jgi:parallel beta-helix repeat protein